MSCVCVCRKHLLGSTGFPEEAEEEEEDKKKNKNTPSRDHIIGIAVECWKIRNVFDIVREQCLKTDWNHFSRNENQICPAGIGNFNFYNATHEILHSRDYTKKPAPET